MKDGYSRSPPGGLGRGSNILLRPGDRQTGKTSRPVAALLPHLCMNDEITGRFIVMRVHPGDDVYLI